jgi:hypothetical protein
MATTTDAERCQDPATPPTPAPRDDYSNLDSLDHLGLVRDLEDKLTPIDALFNPKAAAPKPKGRPNHFL